MGEGCLDLLLMARVLSGFQIARDSDAAQKQAFAAALVLILLSHPAGYGGTRPFGFSRFQLRLYVFALPTTGHKVNLIVASPGVGVSEVPPWSRHTVLAALTQTLSPASAKPYSSNDLA
jgi:hypothetical protein